MLNINDLLDADEENTMIHNLDKIEEERRKGLRLPEIWERYLLKDLFATGYKTQEQNAANVMFRYTNYLTWKELIKLISDLYYDNIKEVKFETIYLDKRSILDMINVLSIRFQLQNVDYYDNREKWDDGKSDAWLWEISYLHPELDKLLPLPSA